MATKQEPIRRNDVIRCEKCGEDYSVTYKRCPFCDERPVRSSGAKPIRFGGRRVAGGGGGYNGNRVNPLQIAGLVLSLVLIIAALYIVFTAIGPLLGKDKPDDKSGSQSQSSVSTSQSAPGSSSSADSSGDVSVPEQQPPVVAVTSLTLSNSDFTLRANESHKIDATVTPSDAVITWTSSNESAAKVGTDGTVVNVNTGSAQVKVTITATAGDKTAQCTVYCRGGSTGTATPPSTTTPGTTTPGTSLSSGSTGRVTNAEYGLNVRSGPGSSYDAIASLTNGSTVTILEDTGSGWYKVTFVGNGGRDAEGYVSKDYISAG